MREKEAAASRSKSHHQSSLTRQPQLQECLKIGRSSTTTAGSTRKQVSPRQRYHCTSSIRQAQTLCLFFHHHDDHHRFFFFFTTATIAAAQSSHARIVAKERALLLNRSESSIRQSCQKCVRVCRSGGPLLPEASSNFLFHCQANCTFSQCSVSLRTSLSLVQHIEE